MVEVASLILSPCTVKPSVPETGMFCMTTLNPIVPVTAIDDVELIVAPVSNILFALVETDTVFDIVTDACSGVSTAVTDTVAVDANVLDVDFILVGVALTESVLERFAVACSGVSSAVTDTPSVDASVAVPPAMTFAVGETDSVELIVEVDFSGTSMAVTETETLGVILIVPPMIAVASADTFEVIVMSSAGAMINPLGTGDNCWSAVNKNNVLSSKLVPNVTKPLVDESSYSA